MLMSPRKKGEHMQKIREWGFPVVLIVVWMIAAAYTLSLTADAIDANTSAQSAPPAATATEYPGS